MRLEKNLRRKGFHIFVSRKGMYRPTHLNQRRSPVDENMKYLSLRGRVV
jgi:hypothetical protein